MDSAAYLRKLARNKENVNLFAAARDIKSIQIFKNITDFTFLQRLYLSYLYFYYSLYNDIASGQVSEKVTNNEIYEDAYFAWKHKKDSTKNRKKPLRQDKKQKFQGIFINPNEVKGMHKEVK